MPKATPSKADLPKMPTKVRVVQDAALYAQRKAQYDADLKEYNQAMLEYQAGQRARKDAKVAGKRQARAAASWRALEERTQEHIRKIAKQKTTCMGRERS